MLAAIVGGGLRVVGFEVPVVSSVVRQFLLALLGVAVAVLSIWVRTDEAPNQAVEAEAPIVMRTKPRGLVAAMPSEVVLDQPTEVWAQVCLPGSPGFVEDLPQQTSSGEEIGKSDASRSPGSVQFIEREGRLLNAVLSVKVTSPYFDIVARTRTISVSPRHDSAKLVFQVIPNAAVARARVFVSVTQQQDGASVTVAEVSVATKVLPSVEAVQVPPSVSLLWNVTLQGIAAAGVPIGVEGPRGRGVPSESEDPPGVLETSRPSTTQESEGRNIIAADTGSVATRAEPADWSPREPRRRLILAVVAVSLAVLLFVAWKLLSQR